MTRAIYDSSRAFALDFLALNRHAYIYACEGGICTVDISYSNDIVYLMTGAKAYFGWTDANADAKALYERPHHVAGRASFSFDVPADTYVPICFFYGQTQKCKWLLF